MTVVGVTPNVRQFVGSAEPEPVAYVPVAVEPGMHRFASLMVRTAADPALTPPALREAIRAMDADLPLYYVMTADELVQMGSPRVWMGVFGLLALIALTLAAVGLSAVTAHSVAQRTQEIGVRLALGARAPQVVWLLVRRTLLQLAAGLGLGLAGTTIINKVMPPVLTTAGMNLGTAAGAHNSVLLASVAALVVIVSIASSYLPARRAATIDPAITLRSD
jgi:ABC-type antimicrobial peptide transport system permease subunit